MSSPVEQAAKAIRDRVAEHGYAMSLDTAGDLARAAIEALQLTDECGIKYDIFPNDVVLGREENPDGSVTRTMKLNSEGHARQAVDSPAPIGGFNKSAVSRLVGPWRTAQKEEHRE